MDAKGHLVLIVEDNERNLKLARDLLGVTGFRTLAAAPPRRASSWPGSIAPIWC